MRKIIKIDESLCNGCGECITACAEGAIELKDGKARVVSDSFCDGLGACLAVCQRGALKIVERDAPQFDECAARARKQKTDETARGKREHANFLSPCTMPISLRKSAKPISPQKAGQHDMTKAGEPGENELCSWPIQMRLVHPEALYLAGAHLLVAGDCTAFACPDIQNNFIRGRVVLVGCPKLDDAKPFVEKLTEIFRQNEIKDISVLHMTVPCCARLTELVGEAIKSSGKDIPGESYELGIDGHITARKSLINRSA